MTDPYGDDGRDPHLEDQLHRLVRGVTPPPAPLSDDVRRGRRRLLRMRVAMAGATAATLGVVLGVTGLTAGDPKATELPPVTQPTSYPSTETPSSSADTEKKRTGSGSTGDHQAGTGVGAGPTGGDSGAASATAHDTASPDDSAAGTGAGRRPGRGSQPGRPSDSPTDQPSDSSSTDPSATPSASPTDAPTSSPTTTPTAPTSTPTTAPTSPAPTSPTSPPPTTPTTPPAPPAGTGKAAVNYALRAYNKVLAAHLDPDRAHLATYDAKTAERRTTRGGGQLFALGTTYDWASAKSTTGLVLTIGTGWDQVDWACGDTTDDWSCHDGGLSGVPASEVASHDGLRSVAVEHADGQVVVLTGTPGSDGDLLAAAADPAITLPGTPYVAPATLDPGAFTSAGIAALVVGASESFTETSSDRAPTVRGTRSVDGVSKGNLSWAAAPTYSGATFTCLKTYKSCTDVAVNGVTVHLALVKPKGGGGWMVEYDGPSYAVRVWSSDKTMSKKRAYAFVTQAAWQP